MAHRNPNRTKWGAHPRVRLPTRSGTSGSAVFIPTPDPLPRIASLPGRGRRTWFSISCYGNVIPHSLWHTSPGSCRTPPCSGSSRSETQCRCTGIFPPPTFRRHPFRTPGLWAWAAAPPLTTVKTSIPYDGQKRRQKLRGRRDITKAAIKTLKTSPATNGSAPITRARATPRRATSASCSTPNV